jgi:hypothetical protein
MVSLVVSWFLLLFLLLVLVPLLCLLGLFLVWVCVLCGVLSGRFRVGFVSVPLRPCLWLVPLLLVRLLSFLVLVRSVRCVGLVVGSGFLFPVSPVPPCFLPCALGLFVWGVFGFVSLVRRRLLWLLCLRWLLRVCVFFLVCCVGFLPLVFPVLVPRPLLLCLRLRLFVRLFPVPVVGFLWGALVVWMRRCVGRLVVLAPSLFFLRLLLVLLVLVRWGRWFCVRRRVCGLLLPVVVVCWWLFRLVLVRLGCVRPGRFVVVALGRGVLLLWLLVWGGVSWSGFLLVSCLRLGLVSGGRLWGLGGGFVLPFLPRLCSCLFSSVVWGFSPYKKSLASRDWKFG